MACHDGCTNLWKLRLETRNRPEQRTLLGSGKPAHQVTNLRTENRRYPKGPIQHGHAQTALETGGRIFLNWLMTSGTTHGGY